jgi:hypothetical protein
MEDGAAVPFPISRSELISWTPLLNGAFGEAWPYLRMSGVARGELDPAAPANKVIVDLDKVQQNARGLECETDFFILRPADPGQTNGTLVCDVTNRGSKRISQLLDDASGDSPAAANDQKTAREAGIGF